MMMNKEWFQGIGVRIVEKLSLDSKMLRFSREQKLMEQLHIINGKKSDEKVLYKEFLGRKIGFFLFGSLILVVLILGLWFSKEKDLIGNVIARNNYGELEKGVSLIAHSEGVEEKIEISVEARRYAKNELDNMATEVFQYLSQNVFPQNKEVKDHLKFPSEIEGYPFVIRWESSNYEVLGEDGTIMDLVSSDGNEVNVTAKLSYYDYIWEREYELKVFPVQKAWRESFSKDLIDAIEKIDKATLETENLILPNEINGHTITYQENKEFSGFVLLILGIVVVVLATLSMDNAVSNQIKERNDQLLCDYAKLVSKLSLYMGAGVSLRAALTRIIQSEDRSRFYVKELEITVRELDNGISESKAVEEFAKRCKLSCYIKLSVLINQNIKKGNNLLCEQLKLEAERAFEERKIIARKYGEEAGTKLLFPMLLMLIVVMVIIMYPAFVSFTV